jgi:hypothetical protein
MLLAVSANNVGIMWVAVEATTIFSAMVIPLALTKASVEASWKYILISSVGIALAFVGTVLAYFDFVALSGRTHNALNWPVLLSAAPRLHPEVMRLAFHIPPRWLRDKSGHRADAPWLPDAHSEAPSPLSAMMSVSSLLSLCMRLRAGRWWWTRSGSCLLESTASLDGVVLVARGCFQPRDPAKLQAHAGILQH